MNQTVRIEAANARDATAVHAMLSEFAEYEKVPHLFQVQVDQLQEAMTGSRPRLSIDLVSVDGELAGCSICYETFSTFKGQPSLFIEDLYVRASYRGLGLGKALMASLAKRCREGNYASLHWRVLAWNEPAVRFYEAMGAELSASHLQAMLSEAAMAALACRE